MFKCWAPSRPRHSRYAGYYFEPATSTYLTQFRTYEPDIARWMTRDPLGMVDGPNVYAYVVGNPINKVDPFGLADNSVNACIRNNPKKVMEIISPDSPIWQDPMMRSMLNKAIDKQMRGHAKQWSKHADRMRDAGEDLDERLIKHLRKDMDRIERTGRDLLKLYREFKKKFGDDWGFF